MGRFSPLLWMLGLLLVVGVDWSSGNDRYVKNEAKPVSLGHGTEMSAVLETRLPQGKNLLWCGTFQLVWNAAGEQLGFPLRVTPPLSLADSLNQRAFERRWIDERSILVAGGPSDERLLKSIRVGVKSKSGQEPKLLKKIVPARDNLVFYAMLHKELHFEKPFAKLGDWPLAGQSVPCFGFKPDQNERVPLLKQVRVHHYQDEDHFLIELRTKETGDQLLLAKMPAQAQLGTMVKSALKEVRLDAPAADLGDLLAVPYIALEEEHHYAELEGRRVVGSADLTISLALQSIDFKMDEKEARLHSEAELAMSCAAVAPLKPRLLVVSPPFLLLMKRTDAPMPYFAAWFTNTDLLRRK